MKRKKIVMCSLVLSLTLCLSGCDKKTDDNVLLPETSTEDGIEMEASVEAELVTETETTQEENVTEADDATLESIVDHSGEFESYDLYKLEKFYEADDFSYYFTIAKSKYVECYFSNGFTMTVVQALADGKITISDLDTNGIEYLTVASDKELKGVIKGYTELVSLTKENSAFMSYFDVIWKLNQVEYCTVNDCNFAYIDDDDTLDLMVSCNYYGNACYLFSLKDGKAVPINTGDYWMTVPNLLGDEVTNGLDYGPGAGGQTRSYAYLPKTGKLFLVYNDCADNGEYTNYYYFDGTEWTDVAEKVSEADGWIWF